MTIQIKDYLDQLEEAADERGVTLHKAFTVAGVPSSTLWRARAGRVHLSKPTAVKIAVALGQLAESPAAAEL
jgi:plasmid maintenance system antidote protein VapI